MSVTPETLSICYQVFALVSFGVCYAIWGRDLYISRIKDNYYCDCQDDNYQDDDDNYQDDDEIKINSFGMKI